MKRHFMLLIFTVIAYSAVNAQSKFGLGVRAGVNFATQHTSALDLDVDVKNLLGYHGGVYVNYFLFDFLAIQPELLVSLKGSNWEDPYFTGKDVLTYLDIPVLARLQIIKLLNIHAGPQFGFLFAANQVEEGSDEKIDIKELYKNGDVGIAVGAEANLPFRVNVAVRYIFGLNNVVTSEYADDKWTNNILQVSAAFRIIGK